MEFWDLGDTGGEGIKFAYERASSEYTFWIGFRIGIWISFSYYSILTYKFGFLVLITMPEVLKVGHGCCFIPFRFFSCWAFR